MSISTNSDTSESELLQLGSASAFAALLIAALPQLLMKQKVVGNQLVAADSVMLAGSTIWFNSKEQSQSSHGT